MFLLLLLTIPLVSPDSNTTTVTIETTTVPSNVTTVTTTQSTCQDLPNEKCEMYKVDCNNPLFYQYLLGKCDKTCGFCGGGTTKFVDTCIDYSDKCEAWNLNGFCQSSFYKCDQKKTMCQKTCKLCNTDC